MESLSPFRVSARACATPGFAITDVNQMPLTFAKDPAVTTALLVSVRRVLRNSDLPSTLEMDLEHCDHASSKPFPTPHVCLVAE